jgi:hypothetical protein
MTTIWVTFQQEGWHCWPAAPQRRAYLQRPHRHLFHFRVEMQSMDPDREIELHDLKEWSQQALSMGFSRLHERGLDFEQMSCEHLAEWMCREMQKKWSRWAACEVSEDGEVGARVERRWQLLDAKVK